YEHAIEHPLESARILLKHAPELEEELVVQSQAFLSEKYKDDAPYWGFQKKEVWQRYMEWLHAQDFIPDEIDVEKAFTNDFVKK
ncbi:MAG: ABC transporter substrate-binding protein, partial [Clostridia bacterium]